MHVTIQYLRYLRDPYTNYLDCLHDYPVVKLMFRKLNHLTVNCLRLQMVEQYVLCDQRLAVKFSSMNYWSYNNKMSPSSHRGGATAETAPLATPVHGWFIKSSGSRNVETLGRACRQLDTVWLGMILIMSCLSFQRRVRSFWRHCGYTGPITLRFSHGNSTCGKPHN